MVYTNKSRDRGRIERSERGQQNHRDSDREFKVKWQGGAGTRFPCCVRVYLYKLKLSFTNTLLSPTNLAQTVTLVPNRARDTCVNGVPPSSNLPGTQRSAINFAGKPKFFPATAVPNSCENNLDKDYTHGTRKHPVTLTWYFSPDLDVLLGNSNPADALCPAPFPCEAPRLCARDTLEVSAPVRWHLVGAVRLAEPAASVSADCT